MPLLHQSVTRSFRLNCQAVEHARLTDREIADVDHLLYFAFPFGEDFPGLESDQLAELVLQFPECIAKTADSFAAHRAWRNAPFQERFLRLCDRPIVIVVRCSKHAGDSVSVNRRNLVDL